MRNKCIAVVILLFALYIPDLVASPSHIRDALNHRLTVREAEVANWQRSANSQLALSIAIGMLGLLVGMLQASQNRWAKGTTVALGFLVSAITLFTNRVYTADYRTYMRCVEEAKPLIEDLREMVLMFDPDQSSDNQLSIEAEFKSKCNKFDLIEIKTLGMDPPTHESESKASGWLTLDTVQAQSVSLPPGWTGPVVQTDKSGTFFVGYAEDFSLTTARTKSLDSGVKVAAQWLIRGQNRETLTPQLMELVKHAAEASDTWFSYDSSARVYHYYTRLRLANDFRSLDVRSLTSPTSAKLKLQNDSAVRVPDSNLTLLLKHMGFSPITADIYVVEGPPSLSESISTFTKQKNTDDKYVARFKKVLPGCDGDHVNFGASTLWCFRLQESSIKPKKGKAQHLGTVGGKDLYAVGFDHMTRTIEVEVRSSN